MNQRSAVDKLYMLGTDVAGLIATIDHKLGHGAANLRFQRKATHCDVDATLLPSCRALSTKRAQLLLEELDVWSSEHTVDAPSPPATSARARVGLGVHCFEEVTSSSPAEGASS